MQGGPGPILLLGMFLLRIAIVAALFAVVLWTLALRRDPTPRGARASMGTGAALCALALLLLAWSQAAGGMSAAASYAPGFAFWLGAVGLGAVFAGLLARGRKRTAGQTE